MTDTIDARLRAAAVRCENACGNRLADDEWKVRGAAAIDRALGYRELVDENTKLWQLLQEVWDTIPADFHGPGAERHARVLNEVGMAVAERLRRALGEGK